VSSTTTSTTTTVRPKCQNRVIIKRSKKGCDAIFLRELKYCKKTEKIEISSGKFIFRKKKFKNFPVFFSEKKMAFET